MNTVEWPPRVGNWYLRWDKGEVFHVTDYDEKSRKAVIETYDGEVAQIDKDTWGRLSLGLADPPQDWAGPLEAVDVVNFGSSEGAPVSDDIAEPSSRAD
jgi:hypothetical protein